MLGFSAISETAIGELSGSSSSAGKTVTGFLPIIFGTPEVATVAIGFSPTHFGLPMIPAAQGFMPTQFGAPALAPLDARISAWRPVRFGAATIPSLRAFDVDGWRATRLGTRTVALRYTKPRPVHSVRPSLRAARFGRPIGRTTA